MVAIIDSIYNFRTWEIQTKGTTVVAVITGITVSWFGFFFAKRYQLRSELKKQVAIREKERQHNMNVARENVSRVSEEQRNKILQLSPEDLRKSLQSRRITCLEAVSAYVGAALEAHEKTNCVTMFILEAFDQAEDLDYRYNDDNYELPMMFGMPISIKESVRVLGHDQTSGYAAEIGNIATSDSILVKVLKEQGFIPFAFTNIPQSLISFGSKNPVYGVTVNPHNPKRTSGGSSSGEGAVIGCGGSIVGMGSDVAGSIRIPSHFSGVVGIKPSHWRMSTNMRASIPGRPLADASEGPMAKTVDLCAKVLQALFTPRLSELDPYVPPVPWRDEVYNSNKTLRIGYYVDDGNFPTTAPIIRAVEEAAANLRARGHTLVPFTPPRVREIYGHYYTALFVDGGNHVANRMWNDLYDWHHRHIVFAPWLPSFLAKPIQFYYGPRSEPLLHALSRSNVKHQEAYAQIMTYRHAFVNKMQTDGIDVLLCPPNAAPAYELELTECLAPAFSYTALFNTLDFAAGVVPFTRVSEADVRANANYPADCYFTKLVKKSVEESEGLPVGVQVAGPPFSEEMVLRVMREVEESIRRD
uniref:fatty acid amide hydrolase n=1 Tax=Panagrellus redivivus TaxID=6233 RepID=A0A7E4VVI9_PANRE